MHMFQYRTQPTALLKVHVVENGPGGVTSVSQKPWLDLGNTVYLTASTLANRLKDNLLMF